MCFSNQPFGLCFTISVCQKILELALFWKRAPRPPALWQRSQVIAVTLRYAAPVSLELLPTWSSLFIFYLSERRISCSSTCSYLHKHVLWCSQSVAAWQLFESELLCLKHPQHDSSTQDCRRHNLLHPLTLFKHSSLPALPIFRYQPFFFFATVVSDLAVISLSLSICDGYELVSSTARLRGHTDNWSVNTGTARTRGNNPDKGQHVLNNRTITEKMFLWGEKKDRKKDQFLLCYFLSG